MAHIYRKTKSAVDPHTRKRVTVMDRHGEPVFLPRWRIAYRDRFGKRRDVAGFTSKTETKRLAAKLESEQYALGRGERGGEHVVRDMADAVDAYLEWGQMEGGRRKHPWDSEHAKKRAAALHWWIKALGRVAVHDMGKAVIVRRAHESMLALEQNVAGTTAGHYREALLSFVRWAMKRGYLSQNPFENLPLPDKSPVRRRRDATLAEIRAILEACPLYRRMLYEATFSSGFRRGELQALALEHLGPDFVDLPDYADKARKGRRHPLWADLANRLKAWAASGEPMSLYRFFYRRRGVPIPAWIPESPLLYVQANPARSIRADMERAGVAVETPYGVLDFHAIRVSYINLVLNAGAKPREAQSLARHQSIRMTMDVYARRDDEEIRQYADRVGRMVAGADDVPGAISGHSGTND